MVTRSFQCNSIDTTCGRCSRNIYVGEKMQADKTPTGPWTDKRCFPSCSAAAARPPPARQPPACKSPKTVTFQVQRASAERPTECTECGRIFRVGDQMTAEVYSNAVGSNKWQNKRCSPPCKKKGASGNKREIGKGAAIKAIASVKGSVSFTKASAGGLTCATCKRALHPHEYCLNLSQQVACWSCLLPTLAVGNSSSTPTTPTTPSKRKRVGEPNSTVSSARTSPPAPPARGASTYPVPIAPAPTPQARMAKATAGMPKTVPTPRPPRPPLPFPEAALATFQALQIPPFSNAPAVNPVPPTPRGRPSQSLQNLHQSRGVAAADNRRAPSARAPTPARVVPQQSPPATNRARAHASTLPPRGHPGVNSRSSTGVQSTAVRRGSSQRDDDGIMCVEDVSIEEQIKRRMAKAGVVNLADAEGLNKEPVAFTPQRAAASGVAGAPPPVRKKVKAEKTGQRSVISSGGGGGGRAGAARNLIVDLS